MDYTKTLKPLFWIVIGVIITLFCIQGCQKNVLEYWEVPGFKTDTLVVEKFITLKELVPDTFIIEVPAKRVIEWKLGPTKYIDVECDQDSLLILVDSLGWELLTIDKDFILQAPTSSKLISGMFTKENLQLNMINTDGQVYSLGYQVNYRKFKYQFIDNELKALALEQKYISKPDSINKLGFTHGFYLSPGFSILNKKFTGSLDYLISYGRLHGGIESTLTIEENPQFRLHVKAGVKLNR